MKTDVIIVGAGLAGTAAAIVLGNAGYDVALVDTRATFPSDFRAEKFGGAQMAFLERLGLSTIVADALQVNRQIKVARFGQIFSETLGCEYGFSYADVVNSLRVALPSRVVMVVGSVVDLAVSDDRQVVTLNDGRIIDARLLVIATGLGDTIKSKIGIERAVMSHAHSLGFGFSLAAPPSAFPFDALVYYGAGLRDRMSYITLFRDKDGMRANLYVYRTLTDDWTKRFRAAPEQVMVQSMRGLAALCPDLSITGTVSVRPIDLSVASGYRHDGVVLIGDAFRTCCPIVGMGIMKVMTDVEQLCTRHIPRWFDTPGMSVDKIASFYDDEIKQTCDAKAHALSLYSRAIATDPGLIWTARRVRNTTVRRGMVALRNTKYALLGIATGKRLKA